MYKAASTIGYLGESARRAERSLRSQDMHSMDECLLHCKMKSYITDFCEPRFPRAEDP